MPSAGQCGRGEREMRSRGPPLTPPTRKIIRPEPLKIERSATLAELNRAVVTRAIDGKEATPLLSTRRNPLRHQCKYCSAIPRHLSCENTKLDSDSLNSFKQRHDTETGPSPLIAGFLSLRSRRINRQQTQQEQSSPPGCDVAMTLDDFDDVAMDTLDHNRI